jgi:heat shock protein 1/8
LVRRKFSLALILLQTEEFKHKQKEVESVCSPIITRLYQSAGGEGGAPPPNMPNPNEPTIEEVD